MKYYLDTTMEADEDIPIHFIRNKVYTKLHKALSTLQSTDIGVSFPKYRVKLGDVIRIHGSHQRLGELQALNWLGGLSGYCVVGDIMPVPEKVKGYRMVSRIQTTMTETKLRKRVEYQKKTGDLNTEDDIQAYIQQYRAAMYSKSLENPYLELQSNSNGHKHRRFFHFGALSSTATIGEFDQFGLSKTATIPWF